MSEPRVLTLGIPCRADELSLDHTLESVAVACQDTLLQSELCIEIVVCLNGVAGVARNTVPVPLSMLYSFCDAQKISLQTVVLEDQVPERHSYPDAGLSCTVLIIQQRGKPRAWNLIRHWAKGEVVIFCDADVSLERSAIRILYETYQATPWARIVTAQGVPHLDPDASWWQRMAALPYRFDYDRNICGALYLMRHGAVVQDMPEDLLFDDAWLTLMVGKAVIVRANQAQVFFLPPMTLRDCFAERVRTEAGKLQLRSRYPQLLAQGLVAVYPWRDFIRRLRVAEWPMVVVLLLIRCVARLGAKVALHYGRGDTLWTRVTSSKRWRSAAQ